jgi:hypothetical protein
MVHDMIPEMIGADLEDPIWKEKRYGIFHACRYIAVSENTARDLIKIYPHICSDSIVVAHNGLSNYFYPAKPEEVINFKAKYGIQKPYFLMVGNRLALNDYKNATLFFKALKKFPRKDEVAVVCVGGEPVLEPELAELAAGVETHVLKLDDKELKFAYSGAICLVYPSLYEGFGLSILEAMACGCPVITCRNSSIPEVAGDAAIYVDEYRAEEMVEALSKVQVREVRQILIEQGLEQVKKFSWKKMADTIADFLTATAERIESDTPSLTSLIWREFREIQAQSQHKSLQQDIPSTQPPSEEVVNNEEKQQVDEEIHQLGKKLQQKQHELQEAKNELSSLQSSKIWKLRTAWLNLKQIFFPLAGLILGLNLIFLTNSIYTYQPIPAIVSWLVHAHENLFIWLGINLISIALILGIVGNLDLVNSRVLRIFRVVLFTIGIVAIATNVRMF